MTVRIRPVFIDAIKEAYNLRRKNIIVLTGDVNDLFQIGSQGDCCFVPLEQAIYRELGEKFNLVRMDIATGLSFYDEKIEEAVLKTVAYMDAFRDASNKQVEDLKRLIKDNAHSPLPTLVLAKNFTDSHNKLVSIKEKDTKPLCIIMQHAGSLFPEGGFQNLSELDRQRLVFFLSWVSDPVFTNGTSLIILINPVRSEVNSKIIALPNTAHIEIQLPDEEERLSFVDNFIKRRKYVRFEGKVEEFCRDSAGLTLENVEDILEVAARTEQMVLKDHIVDSVNRALQASLGDIIRFSRPAHTVDDIAGYKNTREIFTGIFERCDDPETAVSAILVSGPNGAGKTFQLEAYAKQSGRVVIELANIRGSYFGETDKFFECLRWHISTFGKILILIDEAHTAFGSVHSSDTHETEKRLSGNMIKMMGNPAYLGKVLYGLMTSRPDEVDPDVKSRAPIQVPIFDLEGQERQDFVLEMFRRKKIEIEEKELDPFMEQTAHYSARDFRNLIAETKAKRKKDSGITVIEVLKGWSASKSIALNREFQMLLAAQHCTYPGLLPESLRKMNDEDIANRIEGLRSLLRHS